MNDYETINNYYLRAKRLFIYAENESKPERKRIKAFLLGYILLLNAQKMLYFLKFAPMPKFKEGGYFTKNTENEYCINIDTEKQKNESKI